MRIAASLLLALALLAGGVGAAQAANLTVDERNAAKAAAQAAQTAKAAEQSAAQAAAKAAAQTVIQNAKRVAEIHSDISPEATKALQQGQPPGGNPPGRAQPQKSGKAIYGDIVIYK